jgi:hypothetical protein
MAHTPGPWQVNFRDDTQVCDADGEVRGCAPIAFCKGSHHEARSNARLIAAAPDLLAALEALRLAREQDKYRSWEKGAPDFNKAEALADDAIAKAKGA